MKNKKYISRKNTPDSRGKLLGIYHELILGIYIALRMSIYIGLLFVLWGRILNIIILFIIILLTTILHYLYFKKKYKSLRELTDEEIISIKKNKVLINYSNIIIQNGEFIYFEGNRNSRSNFGIKMKQSKNDYIWFHQADKKKQEIEKISFISNHYMEKKRNYKITINPNDLDFKKIMIRDWDNSLVYKGELITKGKVEEEFNWNKNNIRFTDMIKVTPYSEAAADILINFELNQRSKYDNKGEYKKIWNYVF